MTYENLTHSLHLVDPNWPWNAMHWSFIQAKRKGKTGVDHLDFVLYLDKNSTLGIPP